MQCFVFIFISNPYWDLRYLISSFCVSYRKCECSVKSTMEDIPINKQSFQRNGGVFSPWLAAEPLDVSRHRVAAWLNRRLNRVRLRWIAPLKHCVNFHVQHVHNQIVTNSNSKGTKVIRLRLWCYLKNCCLLCLCFFQSWGSDKALWKEMDNSEGWAQVTENGK